MNKKLLMLSVALVAVASVALVGFLASDDVDAAEITPPTTKGSSTIENVSGALTESGVTVNIKMTGPQADTGITFVDTLFVTKDDFSSATVAWTKITTTSSPGTTVGDMTGVYYASNSLYDYTVTVPNVGTATAFYVAVGIRTSVDSTPVETLDQFVYYKVSFIDASVKTVSFSKNSLTYSVGTPIDKLSLAVSTSPSTYTSMDWYAIGLPAGLSMTSKGVITGIPTATATGSATIYIFDGNITYKGSLTLVNSDEVALKVTVDNVQGSKSELGKDGGAARYLVYSGDSLTFDVTTQNLKTGYSVKTVVVDSSGNSVLGTDNTGKDSSKQSKTLATTGDGELTVKVQLYNNDKLVDSKVAFTVLVIDKIDGVSSGIAFNPTLPTGKT